MKQSLLFMSMSCYETNPCLFARGSATVVYSWVNRQEFAILFRNIWNAEAVSDNMTLWERQRKLWRKTQ